MKLHLITALIKKIIYPPEGLRLRKYLPVLALYFCLSFIYNLLRPLKITIVTTASQAGAEIIPFLKVWGIIPGAIFFSFLYMKLMSVIGREKTFFYILSIFLGFYFFFGVFLYPHLEDFALTGIADTLGAILPQGFRGFIMMIKYWHLSLFYVFCEVWSSTVMFMLFWGFVNETTPIKNASYLYPLYNLGGNLASTVAGGLMLVLAKFEIFPKWVIGDNIEEQFVFIIVGMAIVIGFAGFFLFRKASVNAELYHETEDEVWAKKIPTGEKKENRPKLSFFASLKHLVNSPYLLYILVLVLAYNLNFNLIDVLWSQQVRNLFGQDGQLKMASFMGEITMFKGIFSTCFVIFAHYIIKTKGWKFSISITPVVILVSSLLFFPFIYLGQESAQGGYLSAFVGDFVSSHLLFFAVWVGGIQNSMTRGSKYSIYDSTREMAFIPLSMSMKRQGKAVIDGVASRLGKSVGSLVYMILLPICTTLENTIPYVAVITWVVTIYWLYSIKKIDKMMKEKGVEV